MLEEMERTPTGTRVVFVEKEPNRPVGVRCEIFIPFPHKEMCLYSFSEVYLPAINL